MMRENTRSFKKSLLKLIQWISTVEHCDVVYAALCTTRSHTPPRPLIGIAYMAIGEYETFYRGDQDIHLANSSVRLASSHQGSITNEPRSPIGMWAVAIDVGGVSIFEDLYKQALLEQVSVNNPTRLTQAFQSVATAFLNRSHPSSVYYIKAALLQLCATLLDDLELAGGKGGPESIDSFELARRFLFEHYTDADINQDVIAEAAFVSARHLNRLFQQLAACTPMQFLRDLRLQQARVLLETTLLSMVEITRQIGLKDSLHFSRLFRQVYGESPTAYQAKVRSAHN